VLAAYAVLLAIIGKSSTYMLSWLVLPVALLLVFPLRLIISGFEYILVVEALVFFAIAFALDAKSPHVGKWFARLGLVACLAQITFLMSESGVGK
jgi:hypothetical protein